MNVVELFAGGGGLALGFSKAGFNHCALFEVDKHACNTLRANFNEDIVMEKDVTKIEDFKEYISEQEIDVIAGGFPCQTFSYAGKGLGMEDSRGTLFYDMARAIEQVKPKIILGENVKGLKSHDNGKTLEIIVKTFENLGYKIVIKVLNSNDYGVAQKRERLFIVGIRNDIYMEKGKFEFPKPQKYKPVLRDVLENVPSSQGATYSEKKYNVLKLVPPGGCWRDLPVEVAKEYMMKSYYLGGGKTGMARRQSFDEPGLTVLTSPSQKQTERCHPTETRPFTIRENARIQSFPDDYEFSGPITAQYKQIGNAVPVELGKQVALQISNYLQREVR